MKECKIAISQQMLQVKIFVLKYVHSQLPNPNKDEVYLIRQFYKEMGSFLVTLAQFLKTIYPRGENVQAGELAKIFKYFDSTEEFDHDILKNAEFAFTSPDPFDITNTIKQLLNKIMSEVDEQFSTFHAIIYDIDHSFKIGRKISENTSSYIKLDTGTVEIKSTEVARVLIKWM